MIELNDIPKKGAKKGLQVNGSKLALVYCRVSTQKQEDEGTSLESQAEACIAHAKKLGYQVGRVTKEVYSGAELFDRPLLSRDRADIRAGMFQAVIVYAIDRLSRDIAHLAILSDETERAGAKLIFVTEELDNTPEGKLMQSVKAYVAEVERQKIKDRTLRGRYTKLKHGRPVFNGWALYGYRVDRAASAYIIHEPEAVVVRRIFNMYAAGHGMFSIAATFNREGVPSPKSDRFPKAKWTSSTISRILKSRSYYGEEYQWKTKKVARRRDAPRPESEWVRLPDGIRPPIISPDLWEACQQNIRTNGGEMKRNEEYPTLLRGHIFCGECGAKMIRNHFKRGKYEYLKYRCGSRWRQFDTGCKGAAVTIQTIHEWAWNEVRTILLDPSIIERALSEVEKAGPDAQLIFDLNTAKRELVRTERGIQTLLSRFRMKGDSNLWPYIERELAHASREKQQLEKTINELETRINEANQRIADLRYLSDYCDLIRDNLDSFTFEDQRLALRALGFKVHANGDDPSRWRYEVSIPVKEPDNIKVLPVCENY
ncbi:MAG: recombinase family protein [Acidobacteriota bacterium]|nr:recombinase family protein [Acidobacteriota bacterium]